MESGHIKALEIRAHWLAWGRDFGLQTWNALQKKVRPPRVSNPYTEALPLYLNVLETGDTYFMNKIFCQLVDIARADVPGELEYDNTWLQSPYGWLWLESPFAVDPEVEHENSKLTLKGGVKISAVGWRPVPQGTVTNDSGRVANGNATQFLVFLDFDPDGNGHHGFGTWSYFMLMEGDTLNSRIEQFEIGAKHDGGRYTGSKYNELHEIRWIYSAFYLMAQRMAMTVTHKTDRHTSKRGIRDNKPVTPFIKVITLRRLEEGRKKDPNLTPATIEWQWQWEVRPHWRNQYFPSTGEHKPVFIESYIKGPDGKPFKAPGHKIFVAKR